MITIKTPTFKNTAHVSLVECYLCGCNVSKKDGSTTDRVVCFEDLKDARNHGWLWDVHPTQHDGCVYDHVWVCPEHQKEHRKAHGHAHMTHAFKKMESF